MANNRLRQIGVVLCIVSSCLVVVGVYRDTGIGGALIASITVCLVWGGACFVVARNREEDGNGK